MSIRRPAVFLDRDGTLNEMVRDPETGLPTSPNYPEELVLRRQAAPFVRALNELGYLCLVVTNQPGVAKGTLSLARLARIHEKLERDLRRSGAALQGVYCCPHHPSPGPGGLDEYAIPCSCRKPAPGLLLEAAARHHVDLRRSFMVGDGLVDVEAGRRAGVATILVGPADALANSEHRPELRPDRLVVDLNEALAIISGERLRSIESRS